jgi:predicted lipoprotein with Yx(FWY)xxD motif
MPRHRLLPLAAIAAATLALSACGSSGSSTDPYGSVSAPAVGAPTSAEPSPAPSDGPLLAAKDAPNLGKIVTDAQGYTLYRFDKDSAKPKPTTTCVDACATKWPPVTVDPKGKLGLEGVAKDAVGMVQRPDGTSQLTLGGWPVYRFAGDAEPGATGGQGSGGTWFAVTPEGKKAAGTGSGTSGSGASGSAGGAGASGSAGGAASGSAGSGASGSAGSSSGGSGSGGGAAADSGY